MKKITEKLYNWASILDDNALAQARLTSSMPFVLPHLALMPDAHLGKGSTVGSVVPTVDAIIPACVGVDLGCGMIAVKTQFKWSDIPSNLGDLHHSIERSIPLSAGSYNKAITSSAQKRIWKLEKMAESRPSRLDFYNSLYRTNWKYHLGTLGSGNHFIEVTVDEEDSVWLFLHSGSRGIGNAIATHHIKLAGEIMKKWYIPLPDPDLAYFVQSTEEFNNYIDDVQWAQYFALLNREEMMDRLINDFEHFMDDKVVEKATRKNKPALDWDEVAILVNLEVPNELFRRPTIEATLTVSDVPNNAYKPDIVINTAELIEQQTGAKINFTVVPVQEEAS